MVSIRCRNSCEVDGCDTTPQFGVHGHRCTFHSLHVPTIELLDDTIESIEILAEFGRDAHKEDHFLVCAAGKPEVDQDVKRLKDIGLFTEKVGQYVTHVC